MNAETVRADGGTTARHRAVVIAAGICALAAFPVSVLAAAGAPRGVLGAVAIAVPAAIAWRAGASLLGMLSSTLGLLAASAAVVQFVPGRLEGFVAFLLIVPVVALYQRWEPLAAVVGSVFVHHLVLGNVDPSAIPPGPSGAVAFAGSHAAVVGLATVLAGAGAYFSRRALQGQRDATGALEHELTRMTGVLNSSPDGVIVVGFDGRVGAVNAKLPSMWRIPKRTLASGDAHQILSSVAGQTKNPNAFMSSLRELRSRSEDERRDIVHLTDGRVYERISEPHRVGGEAVGRVWTFRDVTSAAKTEAALREAVGQLRARDESKDLFLTAVSHDMRTPLAAVTGFARLLRDRGDDLSPEERNEFIGILVEKSERLEQLLLDLLDLDRLSRGILEARRETVDLGALVRRVMSNVDLGDRPIDVDVEDVHARVDGGMMERVVENLVINAAKHTPGDSEIRVRLRAIADDALLAIEDRGPGISDELKERIFQPFVRGEEDEASPGSGVGLSLVARFIELHDGRAWVEDRHGGGSSFRVKVPGVVPHLTTPDAQEPAAG